jgi:MFS family permease
MLNTIPDTKPHDPFAALRIPEFSLFLSARFLLTLGIEMQSAIVGWQIYSITKSYMDLGYIGLTEIIPYILVSFFSGHIADIVSRKRIILIATTTLGISAAMLAWFSSDLSGRIYHWGTGPIFLIIALTGVIRGFLGPALSAFLAQLVPRSHYSNAATWNSTVWHTGFIAGNAAGGLLCYFGASFAYASDSVIVFASLPFVALISSKPLPVKHLKESLKESLAVGLRFVFSNKIILGALSLDLFAVLFGGAIALLPAITQQVLHVGASEFGLLRAAPALGAVLTSILIAYSPQQKNAGRNLLIAVAGFGIATILFAYSHNFYLSFFLLALTGAFDNVSVVIRQSILQLLTPDSMRGRVSAVNNIFIGSSNEIGAFESGLAARFMGLIPSIVFGGIMTVSVVFATARFSPAIRRLNLKEIE